MEIIYRRRSVSPQEKEAILNDYRLGVLVEEILKKFKISRPTLYRFLREAKTKKNELSPSN